MSARPPRWAESLLERVLQQPSRDEIIGDLIEEFHREDNPGGARCRFALAALAVAVPIVTARLADGTVRDLRLSLRQLRREPGFSAVVVAALALAVGVNATIFAVADEVLLRPLPYPHAERLAVLTNDHTGSTTGDFGVSYRNLQDVKVSQRSVEAISLYMDWQDLTLRGPDGVLRVPAAFVDNAYFELMGLELAHGRWFRDDENRANVAAAVALLSRGAWERIYGGDPAIIGDVLRLNGQPYEVIGVLADDRGDLRYRWGEQPVGVFLPLFAAERLTRFDLEADRGLRVLNALLRLRPRTSLQQARADFARMSAELSREHAATNEGWRYHVESLDEAFFEDLRGPIRILAAGSLLVFLLVAVNLMSLVLIRSAGRRTEMALRRALGARAFRINRQLLAEILLLCTLGGAAGLLLASWGVDLIAAAKLLDLPSFARLELDGRILAAVAIGTGAAGFVLSLAGAAATRGASLGNGAQRASESHRGKRARRVLVTAEVALAFTLLVGAGLVLDSFRALHATGYGFDTDDLLLARVDLRGDAYTPERLRSVAEELAAHGGSLPGVRDAFIWSPNRLGHGNQVDLVAREGRFLDNPEERLEASLHTVHPGTLGKLGIPLLAGRDVTAADNNNAARVALISERLAADLWPEQDPVGRRFETVNDNELVAVEVIGVTADAMHRTRLIDPFGPQRDVYYPFAQSPWRTLTLALRTEPGVDLAALSTSLRQRVRAIDADVPVYDVSTMADNVRQEESSARLSAALVLVYASLAVALAGLGLYGMLAHTVRAQRREIGVRLALGADTHAVLRSSLVSGLVPVAAGAGVGVAASLAAGRFLVGALYRVQAFDPVIYVAVATMLGGVALITLYFPARRASRTDPISALRAD